MAHNSGSNKGLKIVVEEVSKDGYRAIIFDRQPIKWIEILTEWGETLFEGKNSIFRTELFTKAELLQLDRTQFSSLGIFISKKVGNRKISFKSCILGGLSFFDFQLFYY